MKNKTFKHGMLIPTIIIALVIIIPFTIYIIGSINHNHQSTGIQATSVKSTKTYKVDGVDRYLQPANHVYGRPTIIYDIAYHQAHAKKSHYRHIKLEDTAPNVKIKAANPYTAAKVNERLIVKTSHTGHKTYIYYHHFHIDNES